MSKLSSWWHDSVDNSNFSPGTKDFLNKYGLYFIWGSLIIGGILILRLAF